MSAIVPLATLKDPMGVTRAVAGLMVTSRWAVAATELPVEPYSTPFSGLNARPVIG